MVPAIYIQVAGGLNLAALKKPSVAGSVNLPTTCGMKNSAQTRRRTTIPLSRLNLSAHDMLSPKTTILSHFNRSRRRAQAFTRQRRASPRQLVLALQPGCTQRIKLVGFRPIDAGHVVLHLVTHLGLQIGEVAVADGKARQELRIELGRLGGIDRDDLVLLISQPAPDDAPLALALLQEVVEPADAEHIAFHALDLGALRDRHLGL